MKFRVISEPREGGGHAVGSEPGCISEGNTKKEALRNMEEATFHYLEPVEDDLDFEPDAELLHAPIREPTQKERRTADL